MMRQLFIGTALTIATVSGAVHAEERSLDTLIQVCAACHGERGDEALQSDYPLLAGQHASYLAHTLREYRSGVRQNAVMQGQAANLSDREIRALSRYYAAQEGPLYTPTR